MNTIQDVLDDIRDRKEKLESFFEDMFDIHDKHGASDEVKPCEIITEREI